MFAEPVDLSVFPADFVPFLSLAPDVCCDEDDAVVEAGVVVDADELSFESLREGVLSVGWLLLPSLAALDGVGAGVGAGAGWLLA